MYDILNFVNLVRHKKCYGKLFVTFVYVWRLKMIEIKVSFNGTNNISGITETGEVVALAKQDTNSFNDVLGKILYSLECSFGGFNTGGVYDDVKSKLKGVALTSRSTKIEEFNAGAMHLVITMRKSKK